MLILYLNTSNSSVRVSTKANGTLLCNCHMNLIHPQFRTQHHHNIFAYIAINILYWQTSIFSWAYRLSWTLYKHLFGMCVLVCVCVERWSRQALTCERHNLTNIAHTCTLDHFLWDRWSQSLCMCTFLSNHHRIFVRGRNSHIQQDFVL